MKHNAAYTCAVLSLVASILTLTFIACDRFFGIVFAMKAHFIERRATCTVLVLWLLALAVASPLLVYRELFTVSLLLPSSSGLSAFHTSLHSISSRSNTSVVCLIVGSLTSKQYAKCISGANLLKISERATTLRQKSQIKVTLTQYTDTGPSTSNSHRKTPGD